MDAAFGGKCRVAAGQRLSGCKYVGKPVRSAPCMAAPERPAWCFADQSGSTRISVARTFPSERNSPGNKNRQVLFDQPVATGGPVEEFIPVFADGKGQSVGCNLYGIGYPYCVSTMKTAGKQEQEQEFYSTFS